MARGKIVELPEESGLALLSKVLTVCSSDPRTFGEIFADDLVDGLRGEYGERLIREHIISMQRLGFLEKSSLTHIRFKTTRRGEELIGKRRKR